MHPSSSSLLNDLNRNSLVYFLRRVTDGTIRGGLSRAATVSTTTATAASISSRTHTSAAATAAARLCSRQIPVGRILRRCSTAATSLSTATAATIATAGSTVGSTHTGALAASAAFLCSRQIAIGNIFRAGSTAAASAFSLGNLGRTKGEVNEANANQNAHDWHGKQGIHKCQDEHSR